MELENGFVEKEVQRRTLGWSARRRFKAPCIDGLQRACPVHSEGFSVISVVGFSGYSHADRATKLDDRTKTRLRPSDLRRDRRDFLYRTFQTRVRVTERQAWVLKEYASPLGQAERTPYACLQKGRRWKGDIQKTFTS
jgi:hypothetical protein